VDRQILHFAGQKTESSTPPGLVQSRAFDLLGSALPVMITWPAAIPGNYRLCAGQSPNRSWKDNSGPA